ncbi:DUF6434 domain-containing protein [Metabacillus sp. 113a]|uniref:DUF6434 domain-containing protein n=1 Tax=Metabacillus sp. 113a TaxID=3404706 RepID=UPI003CFA78BC
MRPDLTKNTRVQDLEDFYWLKAELQCFCRENGLSASGPKAELTERIKRFLVNGEIIKPAKKARWSTNAKQQELSLETVILENHRCSQHVRAFFKTVIPSFHFSTFIQSYFKENIGKTYRKAADAWLEEETRKKDPGYRKEIPPQFEYNQFTRNFFADPDNAGKSRSEAIEAWNSVKTQSGSNKYKPGVRL